MNSKIIKIFGIAATAMSIGATLITSWVDDKKMDEKIAKKVTEALNEIKKD